MNLPEEKQTLASEIIADQQKEIEKLKAELQKLKTENPDRIDRDKENAMFEMGDCIDKVKYLIDKFMDCYGFNSTKKMSENDAFTFAYNKKICARNFLSCVIIFTKLKKLLKYLNLIKF